MAVEIDVVELEAQPVLVIEANVAAPKLGEALAEILPKVHQYATEQGIEIVGMPFMRYLEMTNHFRIDAGIPIATEVAGDGEIVSKVLPGGKTATTLHLGEYHLVGQAWDAMFAWGEKQGIEQHDGGWDVYENDPTEVDEPGQLRTRLYYPMSP